MSFTTEQYNNLKAALAEGALKVKYQDKEVVYRSRSEMEAILARMENELGINQNTGARRTVAQYRSGF